MIKTQNNDLLLFKFYTPGDEEVTSEPTTATSLNGDDRFSVPFGCTPSKQALVFRLWAPHAISVVLRLHQENGNTFVQREFQMVKDRFDCWNITLKLTSDLTLDPNDRSLSYEYLIESSWNDAFNSEGSILSRRDPYARFTDFDSNRCYVPLWLLKENEEPVLNLPPPQEWNIYELHCGTFVPAVKNEDLFETIISKLDYIKSLGFNCIELMPVQEFGGSWGYNPRLLMSIHPKFGNPLSLKRLIHEANTRGICIVLDLVLNHGSAKLNSLWMFDGYGPNQNGGIYFENGKETGWGRQFNFYNDFVKQMIKDSVKVFIEEYNIQGIRFDSVHNITWEFSCELSNFIHSRYGNRVFLIAEVTPEHPKYIRNAGYDACWIHANYYDSITLMNNNPCDRIEHLQRFLNGPPPPFNHGTEMICSILGNHDQVGNRRNGKLEDSRSGRYLIDLLGGRENWHARAKVRFLYCLQAFSRQMPMIFMGQETLQPEWWHIDKGFQWNLVDGQDKHAKDYSCMVRSANELRRQYSDLQCTSTGVEVTHSDGSNAVLGVRRGNLLIVVNCSEGQWEGLSYKINVGQGSSSFSQIFNSQDEAYGGWKESSTDGLIPVVDNHLIAVNLPKWSVLVFKQT